MAYPRGPSLPAAFATTRLTKKRGENRSFHRKKPVRIGLKSDTGSPKRFGTQRKQRKQRTA
jgi:hypothetical protein